MAITQTPCINNTVLELAEDADLGTVFVYINDDYQWVERQPEWEGIMLTKTERGFELIDKNGRSRKIVSLGDVLGSTTECGSCAKAFVYSDTVECINAVCCGQDAFVGSCAEDDSNVGWCDLPTAP